MSDIEKLRESPVAKRALSEGGANTAALSGYVSNTTKTTVEILPDLGRPTSVTFQKKDVLNFIESAEDDMPTRFMLRADAPLTVRTETTADGFTVSARRAPTAPGGGGTGGGTLDPDLQCLLDFTGASTQCLADYYDDLFNSDVDNTTADLNYNLCNKRAERRLKTCRQGGIFA